jgi:hypothetical protein
MFGKRLGNLREITITDMQQLNTRNKLAFLVSDPSITQKLKKIELASFKGFKDTDLAVIPEHCPNLQWVDFLFSFTYPKTTLALGKHCPNLLYLRLFRVMPPVERLPNGVNSNLTAGIPRATARVTTINANSPVETINLSPTTANPPTPTGSIPIVGVPATPTNNNNAATTTSTRVRIPASANRPLSGSPSSSSTLAATSANSTTNLSTAQNATTSSKKTSPKDPFHFLCSSPESRGFVQFSEKYGKKLRVLDLAGPLGVSDFVVKSFTKLPALHTLFLENVEGLSPQAVVKFAEGRYTTLKRLHLRCCRSGSQLGVVYENYLTKALEVDLIVDGVRVGGGSSRLLDD